MKDISWNRIISVMSVMFIAITGILITGVAAEETDAGAEGSDTFKAGLAIGAGLAAGLGILGAGFAIGPIGAAALGAISEDKKMVSWSFIFIAIAEGLALYGIVVYFLLTSNL